MSHDDPTDASIGYGLARLGQGIAWAGFWLALGLGGITLA